MAVFKLPRPVWLLGWVSLATDAATEAIYPLLPFFLTRVLGAGAVSLGVIEGAAEGVNSILKIYAGRLADRSRAKRPLVLLGYAVSSIARPFIAVTTGWTQVFAVRMLDRVGKGVRSAPRDAMLATWATAATRGRVYGFHRGMDHIGAVIGPVLASLFLLVYPGEYRTLFALTIIPGAVAVVLIFFIHEADEVRLKPDTTTPNPLEGQPGVPSDVVSGFSRTVTPASRTVTPTGRSVNPSGAAGLPPSFTRFMLVLSLFTVGNSTDAFLLLKLTDAAGTPRFIPLMWAALHVIKATTSMMAGSWSDRVGRRTVIAIGWVVYAIVYGGFAMSTSVTALFAWFLVYGFYFGFAEGTEKALVADLAPAECRGLAFGIYNAVVGAGALVASVVFGLVWSAYGSQAAFGLGATFAFLATALLFIVVPSRGDV